MESLPPRKRQRKMSSSSLPSPPPTDDDFTGDDILDFATHVLQTEAAALSYTTRLYQADSTARRGLSRAVEAVAKAHTARGKLIVCGVGKSAFIGMKLVATCKSLGVAASFLHACEAAHGDLGDVRADDVVLFVSNSGKTPELLNLLPHLTERTQIIAMTAHSRQADCPLLASSEENVLLPTLIPEAEEASFGVPAPTTSTTVALAVADMLALTVAHQLHGEKKRKELFHRNHPGGAIGITHREVTDLKKDGVAVSIIELPSPSISAEDS